MKESPDQTARRIRIIRRLTRMIRRLQWWIAEVEWWNEHRTGSPPFDVGQPKAARHYATQALAAWQAGDIEAANHWTDKLSETFSTR